jgi:hypothetical protein
MTEAILSGWGRHPFGSTLLAVRGHQVTATDVEARLERAVRDWRLGVSALITAAIEAAGTADPESQVDALAVADVLFMVAMDEGTGPGAVESTSPAAATVAAAHRIVERLLGPGPVEALLFAARADLAARAAELLDAECRRFERLLESADNVDGRGRALRSAVELIEAVD